MAPGQRIFHFGVLTISDTSATAGPSSDTSGPLARQTLESHPSDAFRCSVNDIVPDESDKIQATVKRWIEELKVDLVVTTGGTGFGFRDVTPEVRLRKSIACDASQSTTDTVHAAGSRTTHRSSNASTHPRTDCVFASADTSGCPVASRKRHSFASQARSNGRGGLPHHRLAWLKESSF